MINTFLKCGTFQFCRKSGSFCANRFYNRKKRILFMKNYWKIGLGWEPVAVLNFVKLIILPKFFFYLNIGTGNAWAWQSNAKLWFAGLRKTLPINSLWKDGGLDPTGSINICFFFKKKTKNNIFLSIFFFGSKVHCCSFKSKTF